MRELLATKYASFESMTVYYFLGLVFQFSTIYITHLQQAHPFCNSTVSSPVIKLLGLERSLLSILTAATSLTITPTLIPSRFVRIFCKHVVFPLP